MRTGLPLLLLILASALSFPIPAAAGVVDSTNLYRKNISAIRIEDPPKIDGKLNEPFWRSLPVAGNFLQYSPRNGEEPVFPTEIRFAFDDEALYVGAIMFDDAPDSILKELGRRDQIELLNTDYISIDILPYNDGINMCEFKIGPSGIQGDAKYSAVGQDLNWDVVWQSDVSINDSGWVAEVRIPYSALRFPSTEEQTWGINMWRNCQRRREYSTWSWVNIEVQEIFSYYGTLTGIRGIKPPLRLSFTPYVAGYVEKNAGSNDWGYYFKGGLDLKLGLSESYTLDMVLIPDFGQVASDDIILNLTPFEIRYDEKRQFFTEATELFEKCGIFYSRRVGGMPKDFEQPYHATDSNEMVSSNPDETRMVNATKISGRNSKGLGLGVFNAMTINTWAEIHDTMTGEKRRVMTQPFTNYNVLVFDQNLKNNSYATLINTNYYSPEMEYCANVSGTEFRLNTRKNTYAAFGRVNISQIYTRDEKPVIGYNYVASLMKSSGNFQGNIQREEVSNTYDINDMGYLMNNNEAVNQFNLTYQIFRPVWKIMNQHTTFGTIYSTLSTPAKFTNLSLRLVNSTTYKNYWATSIGAEFYPMGSHDYYEPRVEGYYYAKPWFYSLFLEAGTDTRKKFRMVIETAYYKTPQTGETGFEVTVVPRFRFSDNFSMTLSLGYEPTYGNFGYVNQESDSLGVPSIYFGKRDIISVNNILSAKYIFNPRLSLSLRARHYWSKAEYSEFYTLSDDGTLDPSGYTGSHDRNFNAFTVDMQFVWYFAPGSELSLVWKNSIYTDDGEPIDNYFDDLGMTFKAPQSNSISLKVLYYLDYMTIQKVFTKKKV